MIQYDLPDDLGLVGGACIEAFDPDDWGDSPQLSWFFLSEDQIARKHPDRIYLWFDTRERIFRGAIFMHCTKYGWDDRLALSPGAVEMLRDLLPATEKAKAVAFSITGQL